MKTFVLAMTLLVSAGSLYAGELSKDSWKVVNYWSRTCAPCRVEIPELNFLSEALAPFNVAVVGVNFDEDDRETTLKIADQMGITFPTLTMATVETLNLTAPAVLPTTYILAPDNTVRAKLIGAQDRAMILAKLAELGIGK
jgi:thiol-disulfide isomerase/thioredoxin